MDADASGATAKLAEFVVRTGFEQLSGSAVHYANRLILDTIGCAVGGFATDAGKILSETKQELGGTPEATMLVTGVRTSCVSAAYVNAGLAVLLDADDTYAWKGHHANCVVLPALVLRAATM
jgi:2-methylcitrate dehydratase PrpD